MRLVDFPPVTIHQVVTVVWPHGSAGFAAGCCCTCFSGPVGLEASETIAVSSNKSVFWLRSIVAGYVEPRSQPYPRNFGLMPGFDGCKFPQHAQGDRLALVFASFTPAKSPVFAAARLEKALEIRTEMERRIRIGFDPQVGRGDADRFRLAEIVITHSKSPVYLVLATGPLQRVIWNLHLSQGARLSGAAVLAERDAGVANVPPAFRFSKWIASAFAIAGHRQPAGQATTGSPSGPESVRMLSPMCVAIIFPTAPAIAVSANGFAAISEPIWKM